ncbi:uncharacterized protein TA10020 [Theileria annulata]|uniref:Integral membrane protein n=1 Tax=Theileria annulata TaxID=5874 RepID=Q4U8R5_THEAN|nr:uncharacterized protein TA10020 [Theileria annulata]CAI76788.1 hypothetical protein, conserved [Theileria annulata]|eukprot:XP_953413.1 hypothetical protein, conserved [Theileria annulata]
MSFDDYSYLAFIAIVIFDIAALSLSLYLWSKYRLFIISLVHNGFSSRKIRLKKKLSDKNEQIFDERNLNPAKLTSLLLKKGIFTNLPYTHSDTYLDQLTNSKTFSSGKFDDKNIRSSDSMDNLIITIRDTSGSIGTDEIPGARRLAKTLHKYKNSTTWWSYLLYDCSKRIHNNEAKLYLNFMGQSCRLLLICFLFSVSINILVFIIFLFQKEPYRFLNYTFQDMLNSKTTTWALYIATWVYSFVTYYFIMKFRDHLEGNKQLSAILRPQLHTLMIYGFDKAVTDPSVIYNHFDNYFPGQVISAHIVMNHSRRLILENKLEYAKLQLAGLYDSISIVPGFELSHKSSESKQHEVDEDLINLEPKSKLKRFYSSTSLFRDLPRSDSLKIRSFSCHNLHYSPQKNKSEHKRSDSSDRDIYGRYGRRKSRFIKRIMTIKNLKKEIDEEKRKVQTTSSRICFVSFADSNLVMHILRDKKILESMFNWLISPAPHPKDIIWLNLSRSANEILLRGFLINFVVILFYVLVTYFLAKLNIIRRYNGPKNNEGVAQLINSSFWHGIIQSLVTLFINSAVHPNLIFFLTKNIGKIFEFIIILGIWTHTRFQKYLLFEHVVYLFTSTIFVPLLASMIAIWRVFDGNVDLLSVELGRILINTSWKYVTTYIINASLLVPCNQLLQLSPLALRYFNQAVFNTDEGVPFFDLGYWYAYHLSVFTLALSFGLFIPYLLPLAALYFAVRFYVDRHNIAYNLSQFPFDTSGDISKMAVKSMLLCVSIMQFMMSGVFSQSKKLSPFLNTILYIAPVVSFKTFLKNNLDHLAPHVWLLY